MIVVISFWTGEASPRPPSKRQQRSAQRLLDYQEKKRVELTAAEMANHMQRPGCLSLSLCGSCAAGGGRAPRGREGIAQKRAQRTNSETVCVVDTMRRF